MSDTLQAVPDELRGYQGLLQRNAEHFTGIDRWAENTASDTSGFTGLMMALIPAVEGVTALFGETLDFANTALMGVHEQLGQVADDYEQREEKLMKLIRQIERELDQMRM